MNKIFQLFCRDKKLKLEVELLKTQHQTLLETLDYLDERFGSVYHLVSHREIVRMNLRRAEEMEISFCSRDKSILVNEYKKELKEVEEKLAKERNRE